MDYKFVIIITLKTEYRACK